MTINKHIKIGMLSLTLGSHIAIMTATTQPVVPTNELSSEDMMKMRAIKDAEAKSKRDSELIEQKAQADRERFKKNMVLLDALAHPVSPKSATQGSIDVMMTHPSYDYPMMVFVVSMIPGSTELQTQSLKLNPTDTENLLKMTLLKADTGYRIYITRADKVQEAINYLNAYKQGIHYNTQGTSFVNPLTGAQMLFVASFNPELGQLPPSIKGTRTIHITLPDYNPDLVQKYAQNIEITDPEYIFGS